MALRVRVVPLAILASIGLLGIKIGDLSSFMLASSTVMLATSTARAEGQTPPPAAAQPPAAAKPAAPAADAHPTPSGAPAPAAADKAPGIDPLSMSPSEIDLLQQLAERRAELDKRAAALSQREILLQAAEKRVDEKIAKLAALEKGIDEIVEKQSQETDQRTKSLVKIYETMSPKDAARIFEQLDMGVLLAVLEHMKERNAAPILAAMDAAKARTVTQALAERRDRRASAENPAKTAAKP
jgi:flagellar motility protein MotE (MotC chaperone)